MCIHADKCSQVNIPFLLQKRLCLSRTMVAVVSFLQIFMVKIEVTHYKYLDTDDGNNIDTYTDVYDDVL